MINVEKEVRRSKTSIFAICQLPSGDSETYYNYLW